jgi:hypothetical protein
VKRRDREEAEKKEAVARERQRVEEEARQASSKCSSKVSNAVVNLRARVSQGVK